jgi:3-dehydroquinate synthetase
MLGVDRYLELMQNDKKVEGGKLRLVLLQQVGRAAVTDAAPLAEICRAIADRCAHA